MECIAPATTVQQLLAPATCPTPHASRPTAHCRLPGDCCCCCLLTSASAPLAANNAQLLCPSSVVRPATFSSLSLYEPSEVLILLYHVAQQSSETRLRLLTYFDWRTAQLCHKLRRQKVCRKLSQSHHCCCRWSVRWMSNSDRTLDSR